MRYREILGEATRPYEHKLVDPALMTYEEYVHLVNPKGKSHPSDAYDWNAERMKGFGYANISEFPIVLNNLVLKGKRIQIRMKKEDRYDMKFVRTDADGEIVR